MLAEQILDDKIDVEAEIAEIVIPKEEDYLMEEEKVDSAQSLGAIFFNSVLVLAVAFNWM